MITAIVIRQPKKADWLDVPIVSGNIWIGLRLVKKFTPFQCHGRGASSTKKVYGNTTTIETIFKGLHKYSRPRLQTYQPKGRDGGGLGMSVDEQFYLLTHGVLDKLMDAKLTAAEWKLWAYLTKLDSWGDRYVDIPDTLTVMQELGISKATYYRAIAKLQQLELFDVQDKGFAVRNLTCRKSKKSVSKMRLDSQKCDPCLKNETEKSEMRQLSQKREHQSPEPSQAEDSVSPQTIQTYTDFIQTLSDSERENFEKFVRDEWKKLTARNGESGEEIVSLERFLAREEDLRNWHQRFLSSAAGKEAKKKAIATSHDWRNDKRFSEWIWEAFNRGYEWVQENESEREQRKAFYDWAMVTNAFEGVCL